MSKKKTRSRNIVAILFLMFSFLLFVIQAISVQPGDYCKDCGNTENCDSGNGLDTGYADCVWGYYPPPFDDYIWCEVNVWGCEQQY